MKLLGYSDRAEKIIGCILWALVVVVAYSVTTFAADELNLSLGWKYDKNERVRQLASTSTQYDINGNGVVENVQEIGTNAGGEALLLGEVATPGFAWFHNTTTNVGDYIEVGGYDVNTNFLAFLKLQNGEKATCFLAGAAPRALSYTNAQRLDYIIVDR